MRKNLLLILSIFLFPAFLFATKTLSQSARISLLTYGPGDEWNSVWGHTALRISDPATKTDKVYNYGYADFQDPYYYLKLAKGKLDYWVVPITFHETIFLNKLVKQVIDEQVLDLTYQEKQKLFNLLEENIKEENRKYKYDYYVNNCTTKTVDIIKKSLSGELVYNKEIGNLSLRDYIDEQLKLIPWARFSINLISGSFIDQKVNHQTVMFLPKNVFDYFESAEVIRNGRSKKLVSKTENILYHKRDKPKHLFFISPYFIFGVLVLIELILLFFSWSRKKHFAKWYDIFWLVIANILGITFILVWIISSQKTGEANLDFIWLNPLLFILIFLNNKWREIFFKAMTIIAGIVLIFGSFLLPQITPIVVLPLTTIIFIKYLKHGFLRRRLRIGT